MPSIIEPHKCIGWSPFTHMIITDQWWHFIQRKQGQEAGLHCSHLQPQSQAFHTLLFMHMRALATTALSGRFILLVQSYNHMHAFIFHQHNSCVRDKTTQPPLLGHYHCLAETGTHSGRWWTVRRHWLLQSKTSMLPCREWGRNQNHSTNHVFLLWQLIKLQPCSHILNSQCLLYMAWTVWPCRYFFGNFLKIQHLSKQISGSGGQVSPNLNTFY